jgi:hypothetical protein
MATSDDAPDPVEVHELSRDILRASEEHFMGVRQETVVLALLALASEIVKQAADCSTLDALLYIRAAADEEIAMMRGADGLAG